MKIASIALYNAYPPTYGAARVVMDFLRHLPGDRILIQRGPVRGQESPEYGLTVITMPGGGAHGWRRVLSFFPNLREIRRQLLAFQPDVIILEGGVWPGWLIPLPALIRRTVPGVAAVYRSHNVEYPLRRALNGFVMGIATWLTERFLISKVPYVTAVSGRDKTAFRSIYRREAELLPNGVDLEWLDSARRGDIDEVRCRFGLGRRVVLFMGAYTYGPNREAIRFLVDSVVPLVRRIYPDTQLVITGSEVPESLRREWVIATGNLPSSLLPAVIGGSVVAAAPIFRGGGTQLKVIEPAAAGVPVVTTNLVARGLGLRSVLGFHICESASEFSDAICDCFSVSQTIADQASYVRSTIRAKYGWDAIAESFVEGLTERGVISPQQFAHLGEGKDASVTEQR